MNRFEILKFQTWQWRKLKKLISQLPKREGDKKWFWEEDGDEETAGVLKLIDQRQGKDIGHSMDSFIGLNWFGDQW